MDGRRTYRTKQKARILDYLKESGERPVTAEEIYEHLIRSGRPVGKATVYRHLDALEKEGAVFKFTAPDGLYACYRYIGSDGSSGHHLVCVGCGSAVEVECAQLDTLLAHLSEEHHFSVDKGRTVLYGTCNRCSGRGAPGAPRRFGRDGEDTE
ncbi:MAG: transcriptional repressor [Clostridiales bacterium]|nr:transcriptional repressor [Clostridiales bacterium]